MRRFWEGEVDRFLGELNKVTRFRVDLALRISTATETWRNVVGNWLVEFADGILRRTLELLLFGS